MDQAALAQRLGVGLLDRGDQPRRPVADHQQRAGQAPLLQVGKEVVPGVGGLPGAGRQADERGLALGGDAPGGQHRLGRGAGVHPEEGGVQEQVIQRHLIEAAGRPRLVLLLDLAWQIAETVDLEIAAWSPSASARVASTSRTDRPRTNDAITSDSRALVLVTCAAEQPGGERLGGAAQLRPGQRRPARRWS